MIRERKRIFLYLILVVFVSGCTASSKVVRPTKIQTIPVPLEEPTVSTSNPAAESQLVPKGAILGVAPEKAKITYSQITNLIREFLDIQPVETNSDETKFRGISENKLVTLEIVGGKDNITQASMKLVYPRTISRLNSDLNNAMMLRFLRNSVPEFEEWPNIVEDIVTSFNSMNIGPKAEDEITIGDKIIQILYDRNTDSVTVTLKRQ